MRQTIFALCSGRFLSKRNLGDLLGRDAGNLQERFLTKFVQEGALELKFPDEINRPDQAYRTKKMEKCLLPQRSQRRKGKG